MGNEKTTAIMRDAAVVIDEARSLVELAWSTLDRASRMLCVASSSATGETRTLVIHKLDQLKAGKRLVAAAFDGLDGIDTLELVAADVAELAKADGAAKSHADYVRGMTTGTSVVTKREWLKTTYAADETAVPA